MPNEPLTEVYLREVRERHCDLVNSGTPNVAWFTYTGEHARTDIPNLLTEIERLKAHIADENKPSAMAQCRGLIKQLNRVTEESRAFHAEAERLKAEVETLSTPTLPTVIRMAVAMQMLRAWNNGTAGFDSEVVSLIHAWIDSGMSGSLPWPKNQFFAEWAHAKGIDCMAGVFTKDGQ